MFAAGPDALLAVHRALQARQRRAGRTVPGKIGLNWFIPALVNRSVGSSCGTHGEDGTNLCPAWALRLAFEELNERGGRAKPASGPRALRCCGLVASEKRMGSGGHAGCWRIGSQANSPLIAPLIGEDRSGSVLGSPTRLGRVYFGQGPLQVHVHDVRQRRQPGDHVGENSSLQVRPLGAVMGRVFPACDCRAVRSPAPTSSMNNERARGRPGGSLSRSTALGSGPGTTRWSVRAGVRP